MVKTLSRLLWCLLLVCLTAFAQHPAINVFIMAGEVPDKLIRQFAKETGIKVHYSTTESNEIVYAKLKLMPGTFDVIQPSSYYADRMRREGMLQRLDKRQLPNLRHLSPYFKKLAYDKGLQYTVPFAWGTTGIFINEKARGLPRPVRWRDFEKKAFYNQLLLLNDPRDAFSMALLMLGYSMNTSDPKRLKQAYLKLKALMPNVKLFGSDALTTLMIDEDVLVGMAWNGNFVNAAKQNKNLTFVYPEEGSMIWIDGFAIPANAPHAQAAHRFINFILKPENAAYASEKTGYSTTNRAARARLPKRLRENPVLYPGRAVMQKAQVQTDLSDEALELIQHYWLLLKLAG